MLQCYALHLPKPSIQSPELKNVLEKIREVTELPIWVEQPKWDGKTMVELTSLVKAGSHKLR